MIQTKKMPTLRECVLCFLLLVVAGFLAFPIIKHLASKGEMTARSIRSWEAWDQELF